jgi:dihydrodipicolinate synthase/N-acetylneuraminate lyase
MGINMGTTRAPFLPLSKEAEEKLIKTVMPLL